MQIGAMNHPARDPIAEIEWIGHNNFDFVDFTLEPPGADPDRVDPARVRAELDRHGLGFVAHTAWYLPLGSPFSRVRAACLEEFRRSLTAARKIGASLMNTHYRPSPAFFSAEASLDWCCQTLSVLCREAERSGITVVLEHVPSGGRNQLEMFEAIMERVPSLGFHLDSGHAKLERSYDRFPEYLQRLGHRLQHVHLSDNDGTADQHLPLGAAGRNPTNWPEHIRQLKATGYDGTITLEVFSPEKDYLCHSRDLLRKWWDECR